MAALHLEFVSPESVLFSGDVDQVDLPGSEGDLGILAGKGSLFVTRPTLNNYTATRDDLLTAANDLFSVVKSGAVKIMVNQTYALRDAAQAHRDLEGRQTTGKLILLI